MPGLATSSYWERLLYSVLTFVAGILAFVGLALVLMNRNSGWHEVIAACSMPVAAILSIFGIEEPFVLAAHGPPFLSGWGLALMTFLPATAAFVIGAWRARKSD